MALVSPRERHATDRRAVEANLATASQLLPCSWPLGLHHLVVLKAAVGSDHDPASMPSATDGASS